jgi:hypothetical protein
MYLASASSQLELWYELRTIILSYISLVYSSCQFFKYEIQEIVLPWAGMSWNADWQMAQKLNDCTISIIRQGMKQIF